MQVILKGDVDHLGYSGDVVEVRKGYWRNYLAPRQLAETATKEKLAELRDRMDRRRAAEANSEAKAQELAGLISRTVLTIPAHAGPEGKLFGSVGAADIAKALEAARKLRVDRKKIVLEEPIKALGTYMVPVDVYAGVRAEMKTIIVERKDTPPPTEAEQAAEAAPEMDDVIPEGVETPTSSVPESTVEPEAQAEADAPAAE